MESVTLPFPLNSVPLSESVLDEGVELEGGPDQFNANQNLFADTGHVVWNVK